MILIDPAIVGIHRDAFSRYIEYDEWRHEFWREEYVGKVVVFNHDLVSDSGLVVRQKGEKAIIRDIHCQMIRLNNMKGEPIYGLFKTDCFDLVDE